MADGTGSQFSLCYISCGYYRISFAYPLSIPLTHAIFSHLKWYAVDLSTVYKQI